MGITGSPIPLDLRPTVVGRTHECAAIRHQFEVVQTGATRIVALVGEPGIGKTRLLDWTAEHSAACGATVLRGGAFQAEGMPPYLPLLEALGPYVRTWDLRVLREQTGDTTSTLATILPDLFARLGDVGPSYDLPPEQARLRLFEAMGSFLAGIAGPGSLVLLLDDLQWADSSTLELLCYVTRAQPHSRLLVVGAFRDDEALENAALQKALTELTRQRRLTTVRVGPLAVAEVKDLAAERLGAPLETGGAELLYVHCDGNPFFAEELLQDWLDTGSLVHEEAGWAFAASPGQSVPPSILAAVQQRLGRLQPAVVDLLRTASVIGRRFSVPLLAAVVQDEIDVVEAGVVQGAGARLIEPMADGAYRFRHDVIRECLYGEVAATRRQRLHEAIGLALEVDGRGRTTDRLADLAFHFARSGDYERDIAYTRQAGDVAAAHLAVAEALAHYQTALDLLSSDDGRRADVLLQVADAALLAGKEEIAVAGYQEAQSLLAGRDPEGAGRAAHGLGVARLRQDAVFQAHLAFQSALTLLGARSGAETVRVLVDLSTVLTINLGRPVEGVERGRQALDLAQRLGDSRLEASAGRAVGNLLVRGNQIAEGMHLLKDALVLANAADDVAEVAECCACLANACYWSADIEGSRDYTRLREEAALRCRQPYELRHIHTWSAFLAASQGDSAGAEAFLSRARPLVEQLASSEPLAFLYQIEGFLAWEQGDYGRAERAFAAAAVLFRDHSLGALVWYLGNLGLAQLAVGKRHEAEVTLAELEKTIAAHPLDSLPTAPALNCAMLMAVQMGDHRRASRYYAQLRRFEGQLHWFLVDRTLATFETMNGDRRAAEAHLDRAEIAARDAGMAQVLAGIRDDRARFARMGTGAGLPARLSRREVDVLRLVATGMSNREIARQLHLSENTVAKHLTSIFNKTDSDNRAAAAAFATRYGLMD